MCFHDYGNPAFYDGVRKAIDETGLMRLGIYNNLGVFQVP